MSTTKLHFGQYDKKNDQFMRVMRSLTDGKFRKALRIKKAISVLAVLKRLDR